MAMPSPTAVAIKASATPPVMALGWFMPVVESTPNAASEGANRPSVHSVRAIVGRNVERTRIDERLDFDLLCFHSRAHGIKGGVNHGHQIDRTKIKLQLACDHARDVEDVFDDLLLGPGISFNDFQCML